MNDSLEEGELQEFGMELPPTHYTRPRKPARSALATSPSSTASSSVSKPKSLKDMFEVVQKKEIPKTFSTKGPAAQTPTTTSSMPKDPASQSANRPSQSIPLPIPHAVPTPAPVLSPTPASALAPAVPTLLPTRHIPQPTPSSLPPLPPGLPAKPKLSREVAGSINAPVIKHESAPSEVAASSRPGFIKRPHNHDVKPHDRPHQAPVGEAKVDHATVESVGTGPDEDKKLRNERVLDATREEANSRRDLEPHVRNRSDTQTREGVNDIAWRRRDVEQETWNRSREAVGESVRRRDDRREPASRSYDHRNDREADYYRSQDRERNQERSQERDRCTQYRDNEHRRPPVQRHDDRNSRRHTDHHPHRGPIVRAQDSYNPPQSDDEHEEGEYLFRDRHRRSSGSSTRRRADPEEDHRRDPERDSEWSVQRERDNRHAGWVERDRRPRSRSPSNRSKRSPSPLHRQQDVLLHSDAPRPYQSHTAQTTSHTSTSVPSSSSSALASTSTSSSSIKAIPQPHSSTTSSTTLPASTSDLSLPTFSNGTTSTTAEMAERSEAQLTDIIASPFCPPPPPPGSPPPLPPPGGSRDPSLAPSNRTDVAPPPPPAQDTPSMAPAPPSADATRHGHRSSKSASHRLDKPRPPKSRTVQEETEAYGVSFSGTSSHHKYPIAGKLGEGTFGEVHKSTCTETGRVVALKRILVHSENDGVPITTIREIKLLKALSHVNVVPVLDMVLVKGDETNNHRGKIYMVFPFMDHDLAGLIENPDVKFSVKQIKLYSKQLLRGTAYLHANSILHRDMKSANLLINNEGVLKIADFGLARTFSSSSSRGGGASADGGREYTNMVVTRWYRPPELLIGLTRYGPSIDLWGVGCVIAEMFFGRPIMQGESDEAQLQHIWKLCGTPKGRELPGWNHVPNCDHRESERKLVTHFKQHGHEFVDLLDKMLLLDPEKRISAMEALEHDWFWTAPLAAKVGELADYASSHEFTRKKKVVPPPAMVAPSMMMPLVQPPFGGPRLGSFLPPPQAPAPHGQPSVYPPPHMAPQPVWPSQQMYPPPGAFHPQPQATFNSMPYMQPQQQQMQQQQMQQQHQPHQQPFNPFPSHPSGFPYPNQHPAGMYRQPPSQPQPPLSYNGLQHLPPRAGYPTQPTGPTAPPSFRPAHRSNIAKGPPPGFIKNAAGIQPMPGASRPRDNDDDHGRDGSVKRPRTEPGVEGGLPY